VVRTRGGDICWCFKSDGGIEWGETSHALTRTAFDVNVF